MVTIRTQYCPDGGRSFRALTLLFAVCEQILEELDSADTAEERWPLR
jgi:hypothetical protein